MAYTESEKEKKEKWRRSVIKEEEVKGQRRGGKKGDEEKR